MNALGTAFLFHFKEQIRSKGFRITSIVISILILGFFAYNHFMSKEEEVRVTVINSSAYQLNEEGLKEMINGLQLSVKSAGNIDSEKEKIKEQDLDHLIIIDQKDTLPTVEYFYHRMPDANVVYAFSSQLQQQYLQSVSSENNLSGDVVTDLFTQIPSREEYACRK